jgi:hypothetical protein
MIPCCAERDARTTLTSRRCWSLRKRLSGLHSEVGPAKNGLLYGKGPAIRRSLLLRPRGASAIMW